MTPSSETDALTAPGGMSWVLRMLSRASGPRLSQRSCMVTVSRCKVLTDGVMPPTFSKNSSASRAVQWPIIISPGWAAVRVRESFTRPRLSSTGTSDVPEAPVR